jgi:release factor glutamine methyltransferase
MTALEKLRNVKEFLTGLGIDDANREAELIISHCLGVDRVMLYKDNPDVPRDAILEIDRFIRRREKREPIQYILGYADFCGLKIRVGRGVLVPRPETELLVEEAVRTIRREESGEKGSSLYASRFTHLRILDLCTGSGCIALALAKAFPDALVYGTEISEIAIGYANKNAETNGIRNVRFLKGNLFEHVQEKLETQNSYPKFDLIVSNPPYIKSEDIKNLQPEVREWEPAEALDGGEDGLNYYRMIIPVAGNYLGDHGFLILEIGINQAWEIKEMARDAGFQKISVKKDYAGIERILIAEKE